jgi:molybdopterin-biosynthesis enzyme MoeA-like protein
VPYEPERADNVHRLNMGVFPASAQIIPNPYNKIGFSCVGQGGGAVHFVPGFPVMAWPMIEWVLDTHYAHLFNRVAHVEKSVIVFGAMEATLTPLMEASSASTRASRCSACPAWTTRNTGATSSWASRAPDRGAGLPGLLAGLHRFDLKLGPELVR